MADKLESYIKKKQERDQLQIDLFQALGLSSDGATRDSNIDKARLELRANPNSNRLEFIVYHGFAGNGSVYHTESPATISFLTRAINKHMTTIAATAIQLAHEDMLEVAREARGEALRVIKETEGVIDGN